MRYLVAFVVAHLADLATTAIGLSRGLRESNGVGAALIELGWPAVVAIDLLIVAIVWAALGVLDRRVRRAAYPIALALFAAPAVLNLWLLT